MPCQSSAKPQKVSLRRRYDYAAMTEACMDLQKFHQTTLDEMVDESECNMG